MSRKGKRYDTEPKLNYKKVFAVIIAIVVLVMFIFIIKNILSNNTDKARITSDSYFAVYADNKWGVINSLGNEVISPSYEEMIIVPNSKKDVFLCTYDIDETTGEYKSKALNSKNEEIFTNYSKVEALENFDKNNVVWYEDNVLRVESNQKYGLIDLSGKELLPCEYDYISVIPNVKNSILVQKDGKYGLVNTEGVKVLDTIYSSISNLGEDYKNGYITSNEEGKFGVVDYTGKQLLENKYDKVEQIYSTEMFAVTEAGTQKLVNTAGETLLETGFESIAQILQYSTKGIVFVTGNKYGVMNTAGETLIPNTYDDLKEVKDNVFIAKQNDKYGIIDGTNAVKVDFTYNSINYNKQADIFMAEDASYNTSVLDSDFQVKLTGILSETNEEKGYMKLRIDDEYKYYNFRFEEKSAKDIYPTNTLYLSKKDGKYGFVNTDGEVIVDYIYDDATEQNQCGYAGIKKDGVWGCIDQEGKVVIEPTYNLDNNSVIDFVGKWHLAQDVNMNYYCEK